MFVSGEIIPLFKGYELGAAETLSEPFVKDGDYSSRSRDPNFQIMSDTIVGMLAVRITQVEGNPQIDHVICLSPNPTPDIQGDAEAFMEAYEDNIGTLQDAAAEQTRKGPIITEIFDQMARQAIEGTQERGLKNAASMIVMKTAESFTNGLLVPRATVEDVCLKLREIVLNSRLSGEQDESLPEGMNQEEVDKAIHAVLAQDPKLYHTGMLAMTRLFPTVGSVQNIVDQYLGSRSI